MMKCKHLLTLSLMATCVVGCAKHSIASGQGIEADKPFSVTANIKRINTVSCQDNDDWYLDGYRVGKSFREHKQKMLSQRTTYCEGQTGLAVPKTFISSWKSGYQQGLKR